MLHKLREILHVYKISLEFVQIPFPTFPENPPSIHL